MFYVLKGYGFRCDDCNYQTEFVSVSSAREHGWAVAKTIGIATARNVPRNIEIRGEMVYNVKNHF